MSGFDTFIIFAYLAAMIGVGIYASRRQKNVEDFYFAGGRLGTFSIACVWMASWIGGAAIVGGASKAYDIGISAGWYIAAMAIGCLLFGVFFAGRIKRIADDQPFLTYPELIERYYDNRARLVATLTTAAAFTAYAAGQLAAAAAILHTLLGWDYAFCLALASAIVVAYTAVGGFLAVTYTDWIQFILLFVGIVFIGIPVAVQNGGTWDAFTSGLPATHFDPGNWGWPAIAALVVSMALSFFVAMDSYTRCLAARSAKVARNGVWLAALSLLPFLIAAVWLGLTAALIFPELTDSSDVLTTFIVEKFPVGVKGLVLVGVLSALMSTTDICILTASANITHDVYKRFVAPDTDPKRLHRLGMLASAGIGGVAALMAWRLQDVLDLLLIGFTINSAALFVPSLVMIRFVPRNRTAAFYSIGLSLLTVIGWYLGRSLSDHSMFLIDPLWPGLAVSALVFVALNRRTINQ